MTKLLTLLLLVTTIAANAAKYYNAKIQLLDGSTKNCYAELPTNRLLDNAIKFKESEGGKTERLDFNDIDKVLYKTDGGNKYIFERRKTRIAIKAFGKVKEKVYKKKMWLLIRFYDPAITYYWIGQTYLINKEGLMITKTVDNSGTWADVLLLFKRPGEEAATQIAAFSSIKVIGAEKRFRKWAMIYFGEDSKISKRIKNKEFKIEDILELAKAYVEYQNQSADSGKKE